MSARRESAETGARTIRVFYIMVRPRRKARGHPQPPRSGPPPRLALRSSGDVRRGGLVANDRPGPSACRDRERGLCSFLHPAQHQARVSMEWLPKRLPASRLRPRSVLRHSPREAVRPSRSACSSQAWTSTRPPRAERSAGMTVVGSVGVRTSLLFVGDCGRLRVAEEEAEEAGAAAAAAGANLQPRLLPPASCPRGRRLAPTHSASRGPQDHRRRGTASPRLAQRRRRRWAAPST